MSISEKEMTGDGPPQARRTEKGGTPAKRKQTRRISEAAFSGREDMVRLLLSFGADPDLPDISGKSPLYWAATNGEAGIVRLLLAHGADPNRRDGEGSALEWAIANGHTRVIWLLNHWTGIRREYLLDRLPLFLNLISRKDRVRLQEGQLIRGTLPYALPHGLTTGPWKNPHRENRQGESVRRYLGRTGYRSDFSPGIESNRSHFPNFPEISPFPFLSFPQGIKSFRKLCAFPPLAALIYGILSR